MVGGQRERKNSCFATGILHNRVIRGQIHNVSGFRTGLESSVSQQSVLLLRGVEHSSETFQNMHLFDLNSKAAVSKFENETLWVRSPTLKIGLNNTS